DGCGKLLSALSLAHRATTLIRDPPYVLLIADAAQIASLGDVDEGGLDGLIPAPVSEVLLANSLDALPLAALPVRPRPSSLRLAIGDDAAQNSGRIAAIAAHPKFAGDFAVAIDPRVIDGLRALGGGPGFASEVIEAFRDETRRIMARIDAAV